MKVLVISFERYPEGSAAAIRQHSLAKLLKDAGKNVFVVGMGNSTNFNKSIYDGIDFISFREKSNTVSIRVKNIIKFKTRLQSLLLTEKFDAILVMGCPLTSFIFLKIYAKNNNIPIIHDSVEWFSSNQFKLRKLSYNYLKKNFINKYLVDNNFKIIAISKFLESHFNSKGCQTLRIPSILNLDQINVNKRTIEDKIVIVYAGSPGKKDYLKEVIEGIYQLDNSLLKKLEFRIIGANKEEIRNNCNISDSILEKLYDVIVYKGRLNRDEVLVNLEEADFTILIRSPYLRYAKAGFPTKVVESLASGTPVICNLTSDLGDYMVDGKNGIVVEEFNSKSVSFAITRALNISFSERKKMYEHSRKSAEESFDYRLFIEDIKKFI